MQFLPRYTSITVAFGLIGIMTLENEIDEQKLLFFGHLCYADVEKRGNIDFLGVFLQNQADNRLFPRHIQGIWKIWTY